MPEQRPRRFVQDGSFRASDPVWTPQPATDDPVDVACAFLQHKIMSAVASVGGTPSKIHQALGGDALSTLGAKFRGERAVTLDDVVRWALGLDPSILDAIPHQVADLRDLFPAPYWPHMSHREPKLLTQVRFENRRYEAPAWTDILQTVGGWLEAEVTAGRAWSVTPMVLSNRLLVAMATFGVESHGTVKDPGAPDGVVDFVWLSAPSLRIRVLTVADELRSGPDSVRASLASTAHLIWDLAGSAEERAVFMARLPTAIIDPLVTEIWGMKGNPSTGQATVSLAGANRLGVADVGADTPELALALLAPVDRRVGLVLFSVKRKVGA